MTYVETAKTTFAAPVQFNLISWLVRLDTSYRESQQLRKTEGRNLKDMGITRQQANTAFYRQFAEKRY